MKNGITAPNRREKVASHNTRSAHTRTREKGDRQ